MTTPEKKVHIRLEGREVEDWNLVQENTGIRSAADLIRYLLRRRAIEIAHKNRVETKGAYSNRRPT